MGILDVLAIGATLIFITLKLLGVIAWSWWWVFSPLIAVIIISMIFLSMGFMFINWLLKR
jgi:hypothetical protein